MIAFVESNFVLELAFRQEERPSCDAMAALAESGRIELVLPAYCVGEPYERLVRRHRQRHDTYRRLSDDLRELGRTDIYSETATSLKRSTAILIDAGLREQVAPQ